MRDTTFNDLVYDEYTVWRNISELRRTTNRLDMAPRSYGKSTVGQALLEHNKKLQEAATTAMATPLFKVGDKVRVREDATDLDTLQHGECGEVTEVELDSTYPYYVTIPRADEDGDRIVECVKASDIELLTSQGDTMSNVLSNPTKALAELELDADTRLLRELNFEAKDGSLNSNAIEEMRRRNWAAIRSEVAADLRKAIAAEKSDTEATAPEA